MYRQWMRLRKAASVQKVARIAEGAKEMRCCIMRSNVPFLLLSVIVMSNQRQICNGWDDGSSSSWRVE